jgi:hypothetical protein
MQQEECVCGSVINAVYEHADLYRERERLLNVYNQLCHSESFDPREAKIPVYC